MHISLIHENKLKVILTAEDMAELDLDYEQMDYADPQTRKALMRILKEGKAQAGFSPHKTKLFIEVYPCDGGGCVLYFTNLYAAAKEGGSCSGMDPVLFQFQDVDVLTQGACMVFDRYSHRIYKSSLYLLDGCYRLIVWPLDYSDRLSVYFLSEYGEKVGEGELLAAFTEEHGQELIRDNAIDILSKYFSQGNRLEEGLDVDSEDG